MQQALLNSSVSANQNLGKLLASILTQPALSETAGVDPNKVIGRSEHVEGEVEGSGVTMRGAGSDVMTVRAVTDTEDLLPGVAPGTKITITTKDNVDSEGSDGIVMVKAEVSAPPKQKRLGKEVALKGHLMIKDSATGQLNRHTIRKVR